MSEALLMISCWIPIGKWLHAINPTIGAAVIAVVGGGLALVGNRWENKRQEFLALRREIYLGAADAFSSAISYLSLMSDPAVTQASGREAFDAVGKLVAKVHLVATKPVIEAITELQHVLLRQHLALRKDKSDVEELAGRLHENLGIIQRGIQMLQNPPPNHAQIFARVQELQTQNRGINEELIALRWRLIDGWLELEPRIAEPISRAVLVVKKELGIKVDAEWYSTSTRKNMRRDAEELRVHLERFRPKRTDPISGV